MPLTGCRVRFAGERPYQRQDGLISTLWDWEITCVVCHDWFVFSQASSSRIGDKGPELDLGRLTRRCPECRKQDRQVNS